MYIFTLAAQSACFSRFPGWEFRPAAGGMLDTGVALLFIRQIHISPYGLVVAAQLPSRSFIRYRPLSDLLVFEPRTVCVVCRGVTHYRY